MKAIRFALLAAVLLALSSAGIASAQGAITYTSSVMIQNLTGSTATVVLNFYNQDGTSGGSGSYTISPNGERTFFPVSDVQNGFNGSLVISSDQDIRAISNLQTPGAPNYFESYAGFQAGAQTINLPLIMCNNGGFNTWFNVQNAGSGGDAHVTITYTPGSAGTAASETATIKAGAALTFNQAAGSSTKNCSNGLGGKFVGSVRITSTDQPFVPIVATAMQLNTTTFPVLMGYSGFTAGSATVLAPLVMSNNSQFYTSINLQNVETDGSKDPAVVTITYGPNCSGCAGVPQPEVFTLNHGQSKAIIQSGPFPNNGSAVNNWSAIGKYVGNATITSDKGAKLVAIINEQRPSPGAVGATYSGFDPASKTQKISLPVLQANNGGVSFNTSVQIFNPPGGSAVDVTLTYSPNTSGSFSPQPELISQLQPGQTKVIFQAAAPPGNGSKVNDWTGSGKRYVGSATITATGPILAVVNQQTASGTGDLYSSYNGFNY
jgi:hypothetical protein